MSSTQCQKNLSEYGVRCPHPAVDSATCVFHHPKDWGLSKAEFESRLAELIANRNGNWVGFIFPTEIVLTRLKADFKIDARGMDAMSLKFDNCHLLGGIDLSGSQFEGGLEFIQGETKGDVTARRLRVDGDFRWTATAHGPVNFEHSHIKGSAEIQGTFNGNTSFGGVTFHDGVQFLGGWIIYMTVGEEPPPKEARRLLFNAEVNLGQMDFRRPNRTMFRNVDMRKAQVSDTDFRGVFFYGIDWNQPSLKRRGIHDEVWAREKAVMHRSLPRIEAAYRNLRAAHEDSKDYQSATDFYVGELECRRLQLSKWRQRFGIERLYKLLSFYGSSPLRAFAVLLSLLAFHMLATTAIYDWRCLLPCDGCNIDAGVVVNSARLLTILGGPNFRPLPDWWALLDLAVQVGIGVQVALLIFALRARIRRG